MAEATLTVEQQQALALARARRRRQEQQPPANAPAAPPAQQTAKQPGLPREIRVGGVPVQDIINIGAGAVRGAGSIGSTLMRPFETAEENALRRQQIDAGLANMLGAQPGSIGYGTGKIGAEIAGTMAVPGMLGGAAAAGGLPRLAYALETGGMGSKLVGGFQNALLRMLGGAGVSGASAALVDPETAGYGAAFGAGVPLFTGSALMRQGADLTRRGVAAAVEAGKRIVAPLREGGGAQLKVEALGKALNNNPQLIQQAENLFRQGRSIEEVAVALRSPALASLARQVRSASPEVASVYTQRAAEQTGRISERASEVAGDVAAASERRAAELAAEQKAIGSRVPTADQRKVGETVTKEREALISQRGKQIVTPAYTKAFEAAQGKSFSMALVEETAADIRASYPVIFDPKKGLKTPLLLQRYKSTPGTPGTTTGGPLMTGTPSTPPMPATATLEEADELLKALSNDISTFSGTGDAADKVTLSNLFRLRSAVLQSIEAGLPAEAAAKYSAARDLARREIIEPFREGWVLNLERTGVTNEPMLLPERVTREVLKNETNAVRFAASFVDSPKAREAISNGIQGQYQREVVRGGAISPARHEAFMRKYGPQIDALDSSGLTIRQTLDDYARGAKNVKDLDAIVDAEYGPLREQADAVLKEAERLSGTVLKPATRAEALTKARQRAGNIANAEAELADLAREIETGKAFTQLATEGDRIGIKIKKLATDAAGQDPTILNRVATITFNIMRRFRGEVDEELAAELAMDLLSADKITLALQKARKLAMPPQKMPPKPSAAQKAVRSPAGRVAPGVVTSNMLAPENQNALAE